MRIHWSIILVLIAIISFLIFAKPDCGSHQSRDWTAMHAWLKSHSYTQAETVTKPKPEQLPPEIKRGTTATVSGDGYWIPEYEYTPEDTLPVELTTVALEDGTAWARVTISGKPAVWQRLEYYHKTIERRWTGFFEVVNCPESITGIGAGYRVWEPLDINVVPSISVSTHFDWIAPEIRLTRNVWSGVSVGAGGGYRFGLDSGLHLSASVGIEL